MKFYKLEGLTEYGTFEENGYFINKVNAEKTKEEMDNHPMNSRYGIKQNIVEIETDD